MASSGARLAIVAAAVSALAIACVSGTTAEARQGAKKAPSKGTATRVVKRRTVSGVRGDGWEAFPGYPGFRDRTTIDHPNGKLNGQELFDSIGDRAGNAGE